MRSIYARILLWSLTTAVLALASLAAISYALSRGMHGPPDFFVRTIEFQRDDAILAYEQGGKAPLAAYLARLDSRYPAEHHLADAQGRDLVSGLDRSAQIGEKTSSLFPPRPRGKGPAVRPPMEPPSVVPYVAAIVVIIAGLGYLLAVHMAAPLRRLRRVVDCFGQGDLSIRMNSTRRDEIGQLSRAFDEMADRIETLLSAERRLLQDVSHELRSPLARLGFAVELARTSDDRNAALNRIRKDVDRLASLVDALLQLTRAEGDPSSQGLEHLRLDALLTDLRDDCKLEAEARSCALALQIAGPVHYLGDAELLRRAFENVVRNAIRYAPERTAIEIELTLDSRNKTARLSVRDYGPGVPEEMLDAIFQPFVRVGDDRSRSSGGVGLGLSITRRAVALHKGTVRAQNAHPGLGVTIELPLLTKDVEPRSRPVASAHH